MAEWETGKVFMMDLSDGRQVKAAPSKWNGYTITPAQTNGRIVYTLFKGSTGIATLAFNEAIALATGPVHARQALQSLAEEVEKRGAA